MGPVTGLVLGAVGVAALLCTPPAQAVNTQQEDRAADRAVSQGNLKQIAVAFHNYHAAYNTFPPQAISKSGKPLLSWRVALLPYLEQEELYKQFKLDEPWDSENNKKLLAKMPKVYAAPNKNDVDKTYYQVFAGKNTIFDGPRGIKIPEITDGTSNTFLVVEAGTAVPWTKPDDVAFDPAKPLPELGGIFKSSFNVAMADGSVRSVSKPYDEKVVRLFVSRNSGMPRPNLK
jgi:prepilin-type processing-associated H-X9-DG protein